MEIKCESCNETFTATSLQQERIKISAEKGKSKLVLNCPSCRSMVMAKPLVLMGKVTDTVENALDSRIFCCPTTSCIGFIEKEDGEDIFGCAECGTEWASLDNIYSEISKVIALYPYRQKVYIKDNEKYTAISFENIPKSYYKKVQTEKVF